MLGYTQTTGRLRPYPAWPLLHMALIADRAPLITDR